jgi:hypothetical protein
MAMCGVHNSLDVYGPDEEISRFISECFSFRDGSMTLDFARIFPIPSLLAGEVNTFAQQAARVLRNTDSVDPKLRQLFSLDAHIEDYFFLASAWLKIDLPGIGVHSCEELISFMLSAYSGDRGRSFHAIVGADSISSWAPVPRDRGRSRRPTSA